MILLKTANERESSRIFYRGDAENAEVDPKQGSFLMQGFRI
jgi:hypothetical protein